MRFGLFMPRVGAWIWSASSRPSSGRPWPVTTYADDEDVFESIWVYDHFHTVPIVSDEATHEAWTLMSALAVATTRIRLGQMCTCGATATRPTSPKVAATVDVISGGRLEMGIGGGWYEKEWRAYGTASRPPVNASAGSGGRADLP